MDDTRGYSFSERTYINTSWCVIVISSSSSIDGDLTPERDRVHPLTNRLNCGVQPAKNWYVEYCVNKSHG